MQSTNNDFSAVAFYLAGYAVELTLKARICELLDADNFYGDKKNGFGKYHSFKIHDIESLIVLAGLQNKIKEKEEADKENPVPNFKTTFSVVKKWKETSRYELSSSKLESEVFIKNAKIFIQWIEQQKIT